MREDSTSLHHRRTLGHKGSTLDESVSYSVSETSAQSSRRVHDRSSIFPSRFDFALVIIGLETGVLQLMFIFIQAEKYGGVLIFLTTFLITIFISLPFMAHQIFYGFYTKFGYLKIWNMAPVGFGIGLTAILYSIYECVVWAAVAGLLILNVCHVPFRSISEWTTCKEIERPEGVLCYNTNSTLPVTSCELTTYPALEYYREISYKPQLEATGYVSINAAWFVCCLLVWLIVFVMVSQGFRRLRHILVKIPIFCLVSLSLLAVFSFGSQKRVSGEDKKQIFHLQESPTRYTIVWLVWHTIRSVQIPQGTLTQLGSYSPAGYPVLADTVMIATFVCFYDFAFTYFGHCCHIWVQQNFVGIENQCLAPDQMTALFASIPTAISFLAMGNLWLFVYYTTFALKTITHMVITLTATMNAMSEMFHLHRHRQQIVAVVCAVALLLNLPLTMINSELFFNRTYRYVELLVELSIVMSSGLITVCLYTLSRVFDDIHFVYNAETVLFQKFTAYLASILMIFIVITGFTSVVSRWPGEPLFVIDSWAGPFIGFMVAFFVAPIPATALYMYVVHLMKHNISAMLQPTAIWGPPGVDAKYARLKFNPRCELRHISKNPCTHNCLLNNFRLIIEGEKRESQRTEFFLNVFQNRNFAEWDNDADWHYGGGIIGKAYAIDWADDSIRVLNPTLTKKRDEEQGRNKTEEKTDKEEDVKDADALEEDVSSEEDVELNGNNGATDAVVEETLMLEKDTEIETELDLEPDIIFPDPDLFGPLPRVLHQYDHDVADRTLPLPRYTAEHPKYLRQRKSSQQQFTESAVEPPVTRKMYSEVGRKLKEESRSRSVTRKMYSRVGRKLKEESRSKSSQTEKGIKRLRNVMHAILPWKKRKCKKHRCVGTSSGCRRPPTPSGSSKGSETFSETDEWP